MAARSIGLLAVALVACGDPLAPGGYLGTPRIHLGGIIKGNPGYGPTPVRPRMGVLWSPLPAPATDGRGALSPAVSTTFPAQFDLDLFDAPEGPPGEVRAQGGSLEALIGFGRLVAVDDVDGDGRFTISGGALAGLDRFIGAAPKHIVLYADGLGAPGPGLRQLIANVERLSPGYQIARGLCGQDGEPDRLELVAASAPVAVELVPPASTFPEVAGCLRLSQPGTP